MTAAAYIGILVSHDSFGHGVFSLKKDEIETSDYTRGIGAFVGRRHPDKSLVGVPVDFAVTVNDGGVFFNASDPADL